VLDRNALFVLIILLYAFDSFSVASRSATAFIGWRPRRWSLRTGFDITFGEGRQIFLGSLLPPLNPLAFASGSILDVSEGTKRLKLLQRQGVAVRALSNALFLATFVALPVAVIVVDAARVIWGVVGLILALWIATVVSILRARRALAAVKRQPGVLAVILSPLSTMRGQDTLAGRLFDDLHPLAVAVILCDEPLVGVMARRYFYSADNSGIDHEIERFLAKQKLLHHATAAPTQEFGTHAYCPRCWTQYVEGATTCTDCASRPLIDFPRPT
jgi:hypothetical protein